MKEDFQLNNSLWVNLILVVLILAFFYFRFGLTKGLKTLSAANFEQELKGSKQTVLIDVREPGEFKGGHIQGAKNIPLSQLDRRLGEIPKDRDLLLYCRSGMRSKSAARILMENGFTRLAHLRGGISAWSGPVSKGQQEG